MSGVLILAWRRLSCHWAAALLLMLCLGVALALPIASRVVAGRFEASISARARTTPMLIGAKGSRFDLVFASLYFRPSRLAPTPYERYADLLDEDDIDVLPINSRFTAQRAPVVATSFEYVERRGLELASGRWPARLGETAVGASAAVRLGLQVGDRVFSDPVANYDITAPPTLELTVSGVIAPTDAPEDEAFIIDLETVWILEGAAHGHADAASIDRPDLVIGRTNDHIALSEGVTPVQSVTAETARAFHLHGERDDLPLTSVLVFPRTDKAAALLSARINATPDLQAVRPVRVVEELMQFIVRLRTLLSAISGVLLASTIGLVGLIALLSYQTRRTEFATLREIGAGRQTIAGLILSELALLLLGGVAAAAALTASVVAIAPWFIPYLA